MSGDDLEQGTATEERSGSFFWGASWAQRKRYLRIEGWVLVVIAYALILFAYAWPADFRNTDPVHVSIAWVAARLRTFIFHGGLILAAVVAVAVLGRCWRLVLATLPLLAVMLGPALISYLPSAGDEVRGEALTVMSVNLLMINRDTGPIIEEVEAARPDLLLLQEYTDHWHSAFQRSVGADYPYVCFVTREDSFGAAIYSRRPFVEEPELYIPLGHGTEPQMRASIEIDGREVAVYNVHLMPPWGIAGTIENRTQFADLVEVLADEARPVILGGDFNFTERSPNASVLGGLGLIDAHSVGGWGRGVTWPANSFFRWVPGIRLDHIYLGGGLTCTQCRTGVGAGSDHRPVVAGVGFRR